MATSIVFVSGSAALSAHRIEAVLMVRRGVGRGPRAVWRTVAIGAISAGCSGDAFHLAAGAVGSHPDSGTFPPLVTDSTLPDAQGATPGTGDAGGNGGTSGSNSDSGAPSLSQSTGPCGAARLANAGLADEEVCVAAGTFDMGSAQPVSAGYFAHGPVHAVTLSAFFLDAYEVSVARYRRCVEAGACSAPSSVAAQGCTYTPQPQARELLPVTCVSWQAAQDFCTWDGGRRLPSEAEWEQAARNSAGSKYPWGDTFGCDRAVLAGASQCPEYSGQLPQLVGSARGGASPERVYDLTGNAAEWAADWFGGYSTATVADPGGPATGSLRIQRGGGWLTLAADAASYARRGEVPAAIGPFSFRCARAPDP